MQYFGKFLGEEKKFENRITQLFTIQYPIIQAGMIWASGWKLASAVSEAGGLGLIGAGSMYPEVLEAHILKCMNATNKPFGVNLPLLYPDIHKHIEVILKHKVPIVFTSAGNPKTWTQTLKDNGIIVVHVVSSAKFAIKCQDAGVDAVVAEGFEAGGHNGREETTTLCLLPSVRKSIHIPLIAAGGIGDGASMLATMVLGAEGVQIGSRFVCTPEASSHINFKNRIVEASEGDTELVLKRITPVRLLKNDFYSLVKQAESDCVDVDTLSALLGRARAKKGMFEGDMTEGELEIGQISALIDEITPAGVVVQSIWSEFNSLLQAFQGIY
ncbi:MAG: nitronate monooxygenase [Bacteroidetes bacterium]|nr:nitronate monooxygenase [Bacteroidota bacterium]MBK8143580.1 nitronate monooxygenase [Bacteroidota bacterium]MBP6314074.1 nitronate monooxygenase [Chitinophagaceae bacterium]